MVLALSARTIGAKLLVGALCAAALLLVAFAGQANAEVKLGRTIALPIDDRVRYTYTVAPDDTFWLAGANYDYGGGVVKHLDQNGQALDDGFEITRSYFPLGIAYYNQRLYSATGYGSGIVSWQPGAGSQDPGELFSDYTTKERIGSNAAGIRAFGSAAVVPGGQSHKVALLDLSNLSAEHPFYAQAVFGWGINETSHPGTAFGYCTVAPPPPGGSPVGPGGCTYPFGDPSTATDDRPGHLNSPIDVAAGPNRSLYVLEGAKNRVATFVPAVGPGRSGLEPSIRFPASAPGSGVGQLNGVHSIVRNPRDGHLFVSETTNRRISEFNGSGGYVGAFGWGVRDGANQFQVCTSTSPCRAGRADQPLSEYRRLDVNSAGQLYAQVGAWPGATVQVISLGTGGRRTSTTSVACTPKVVPAGGQISCTATVRGAGGTTPKGSVAFSTAGDGVFAGRGSCSLSPGANGSASCRTSYAPVVIGRRDPRPVSVTGAYSGGDAHVSSKGTTTVSVAGVNAPTAGRLTFSSSRFRAAPRRPMGGKLAAAASPAPIGTVIYFKLGKQATKMRFKVLRQRTGRKVKRGRKTKCVKQTRRNRRKKACKRYTRVKGSFIATGRTGINAYRFNGRLAGKKLAPGKYRLTGTPVTTAKPRRTARASFRIVR